MSVSASKTRVFSVAGHIGSGKTSLCDLMLFKSGAVSRLGKVAEKTSVSDYTAEEQDKLSSIHATALNCHWKDHHLFFIDTPGYGEFVAEPIAAITSSDMALVVVNAEEGIEIGCSRAMKIAKAHNIPRAIFINGMDKSMADFNKVLGQLREAYGKTTCVPIVMPIGQGDSFEGVVHILRGENIPEEAEAYKELLMDTIAESDEDLMTRYLEGEELSEDEISQGLKSAILEGALIPVFAGSVEKDLGVEQMMNGTVNLFPDPLAREVVPGKDGEDIELVESGEGVARVFKSIVDPFIGQMTFARVYSGTLKPDTDAHNLTNNTKERFGHLYFMNGKTQEAAPEAGPGMIVAVAKLKHTSINDTLTQDANAKEIAAVKYPTPVMSLAITATKSGEEDKIGAGLHKIASSDPTVKLERHSETHELLLSGMGDVHLHNVLKRLKEESKVEVNEASPKVPYRETITSNGEGHYRHKKQTGGHGQFAEVYLRVAPNPDGYEFKNEVVGGNIPKNFIPAVEKGVAEAMVVGPLAGCKVENLTVTVYDGKHHDVDSSEMAFKIASRAAFRDAMHNAKPILMEPIQTVKIMVPDQYMGDISGDLNHKRGRIQGMGVEEGMQVVKAEVPLAEMSRYATELRSITQGRGTFEMEFHQYEQVPANVAKEIIDNHMKTQEEQH